MKKHRNLILAVVLVILGEIGWFLRRSQHLYGFEADTHLAVVGSPYAVALAVFSAAVALASALCLFFFKGENGKPFKDEDVCFYAEGNTLFLFYMIVSAVALLLSSLSELFSHVVLLRTSLFSSGDASAPFLSRLLPPLRIVFSFLGFFCVIKWGMDLYRGKTKGRESLPLAELCFTLCICLVGDYQANAANPVLQETVYPILRTVSVLLAFYYLVSRSFDEKPKKKRTLFFCLLGIYFCLVTVADIDGPADGFRLLFSLFFLAGHTLLLVSPSPESDIIPSSSEENTQTHTEAADHE